MTDHSLDTAPNPLPKSGNEFQSRLANWVRSLPKDRVVWAFIILALGTWFATSADQAISIVSFAAKNLVDTGPFIIASVMIAAFIKATGADKTIARALSGRQETAIITGALFGALSPFCSCGVVPLIAALLRAGVPLAPVIAFCLASPVIDPEMMVLTWGVLGAEMTLAKTLAAIGMGVMAGATVIVLQRMGYLKEALRPELGAGGCASSCTPKIPDEKPYWAFWQEQPRRQIFAIESGTMGWFLFKWLSLAFLLEGMMVAWVPMEQVGSALSDLGAWSIPAAAGVGVPAYLNGYAAIPLVRGLMDIGLEPGAALAFMVAGGVTSIPAAMAFFALVRPPTFALYLVLAAVGSVSAGFLYAAYLAL